MAEFEQLQSLWKKQAVNASVPDVSCLQRENRTAKDKMLQQVLFRGVVLTATGVVIFFFMLKKWIWYKIVSLAYSGCRTGCIGISAGIGRAICSDTPDENRRAAGARETYILLEIPLSVAQQNTRGKRAGIFYFV